MKKINSMLIVIVLFLILNSSVSFAKWVSIGYDDTWNDGLFKGNSMGILGFCLDTNNNPHLLCRVNGDDYYLYFDGKSWKGLEGDEPTELSMIPEDSYYSVMRLDTKNRPHFLYFEEEDSNVSVLYYLYWKDAGWSEKNEVIRTNRDIDKLFLLWIGYNFTLDKNDQLHIIYLLNTLPMQDYNYICYRYIENGEWKTLGDADKDIGVFKEITDISGLYSSGVSTWYKYYIKLDNKGYPHIACLLFFGPELSSPSSIIYTYFDGEKWTGIDDSQKTIGLPDSYIDVEGDIPKNNFNFHIDEDDNVHFIYTAKIDDISRVIYRKWDGSRWSGLNTEDKYSNIKLDFINRRYLSNLSNNKTPNILTTLQPAVRYHYWNGSSWAGLGGSDELLGIIPTGFIDAEIKGFEFEENPKSVIAGIFYIQDSQGNYIYHISVLKWEEETNPTIELYTNDLEHPVSDPIVRIYGRLHNPFDHDTNINLIVAMMNPEGEILFFPGWTKDYSSIPLTLPAGYALPWTELLNFALPSDSPPVKTAGTYYFGILLQNPDTNEYYTYDIKPFYVVE